MPHVKSSFDRIDCRGRRRDRIECANVRNGLLAERHSDSADDAGEYRQSRAHERTSRRAPSAPATSARGFEHKPGAGRIADGDFDAAVRHQASSGPGASPRAARYGRERQGITRCQDAEQCERRRPHQGHLQGVLTTVLGEEKPTCSGPNKSSERAGHQLPAGGAGALTANCAANARL